MGHGNYRRYVIWVTNSCANSKQRSCYCYEAQKAVFDRDIKHSIKFTARLEAVYCVNQLLI